MLADLDEGRVDAVVVWHTDRLHRSPRELEEYVDVCEHHKVVTQTVKAGELDLATPSGRAMARTLGAWARFEVEHKSERTRAAQLQAAQAGRWLGGGRPFGWQVRDDGTADVDDAEAAEVRRAAAALLDGASLGSVVADLNARGVKTATGRQWSYTSVRQVLTRPRNAGLSEYQGEVVGRSLWPALLSEDTWRSVCALLTDPDRRRSSSNRVRWLLAGLALCGKCAAPLRSATATSNRAKGTTRTVYRCTTGGPGHVARAADPLDQFVSALVVGRLSRPDAVELMTPVGNREDAEALRVEAVTLRRRLDDLASAFADGDLTRSQLTTGTERVRGRLAEVEAGMAAAARGSALGVFAGADPATVWDALAVDRRRAVVAELMTVTVLPSGRTGRTFDPEHVSIQWRNA